MTRTALEATSAFYQASPGIRLFRLALGAFAAALAGAGGARRLPPVRHAAAAHVAATGAAPGTPAGASRLGPSRTPASPSTRRPPRRTRRWRCWCTAGAAMRGQMLPLAESLAAAGPAARAARDAGAWPQRRLGEQPAAVRARHRLRGGPPAAEGHTLARGGRAFAGAPTPPPMPPAAACRSSAWCCWRRRPRRASTRACSPHVFGLSRSHAGRACRSASRRAKAS